VNTEKATFAAGCFWHVQLEFSEMPGVLETTAGYTGGKLENPTYEQVCSGRTGHLEAVELEYDKEKVSYDELLKKFFDIHDPTTIDRQGPDRGSQYNSAIFYHTREQEEKAKKYKEKLIRQGTKVVTRIEKAGDFYPAEDYHQNYLKKRNMATCFSK
jgi:peptide methionine sulfoxide reductase msrA/msrB